MINIKQIAKFVVGLGDKVAPTDVEEGMRVGVDRQKYQVGGWWFGGGLNWVSSLPPACGLWAADRACLRLSLRIHAPNQPTQPAQSPPTLPTSIPNTTADPDPAPPAHRPVRYHDDRRGEAGRDLLGHWGL